MSPRRGAMRRSPRGALGALALVAALACLPGCKDSSSKSGGAAAPAGPPVHVSVTVDWEGAYFDVEGLAALEAFRAANPGVPITHLFNAAYFTKPGADVRLAVQEMKRALRPGDEAGLHLHLWRSLVASAGVTPRLEQSFLSRDGTLLQFEDDVGFEVDPAVYSVAELRAIVRRARELLVANELPPGPIFRAGGWLAHPALLEAIRAEGFTIDTSAIDSDWLDSDEAAVLRERVAAVWPKVDPTTQPFWIDTPAGRVLEMPDSGGLADHVTADEMVEHVTWAAGAAAKSPDRPVFVQLGFHAETAHHFASRLTEALATLRARGVPMRLQLLSKAAEAARAELERASR